MEELDTVKRREFLLGLGKMALAGTLSSALPNWLWAETSNLPKKTSDGQMRLSILHTNDVHSRIDPFPMDGSKWQGLGGAARRAALIKQIRQESEHVLLFDAGDMVQGTPYYNLFHGELEMKLMNQMGYDAVTFGNHEFDNGLEQLGRMMEKAKFPFLNSNYDLSDTPLVGRALPYKIFNKNGVKIGVFGLGIELEGSVDPNRRRGVQYNYPLAVASEISGRLKHDFGCDLVICLSHLGYRYDNRKISDRVVASETYDIDLIIGGHTHTFMPEPEHIPNKSGKLTTIHQVGFAGVQLGRIDFVFDLDSKSKQVAYAQAYPINSQALA